MINATNLIGLTGNIATGKSVVRRMLENTGALGIDSDIIAHRMIYPGGPAYQSVIAAFGKKILGDAGEISRSKLGKIVFSDHQRLVQLESLLHPLVTESILQRVQRSSNPIVVIEAIKLLETQLGEICDSIWVSDVSASTQLERLVQGRNMSEEEARTRLAAQPPQSSKLSQADVVIHTNGPFKNTWQQIQMALNDTIQAEIESKTQHINSTQGWKIQLASSLNPDQLEAFWEEYSGKNIAYLYEALGMKMVLPLLKDGQLTAIGIMNHWNFTASMERFVTAGQIDSLSLELFAAIQEEFQKRQCESIIIPEELIQKHDLKPKALGFQQKLVDQITYPAWRQAVQKNKTTPDPLVWVKFLNPPPENEEIIKLKNER